MSTGSIDDPYIKDPNATLDYTVNWATYLGVDTISTDSWILPTGITSTSESNTTTTTTIWLTGGTHGTRYALINRIVTVGGRTDDRTIYVKVVNR